MVGWYLGDSCECDDVMIGVLIGSRCSGQIHGGVGAPFVHPCGSSSAPFPKVGWKLASLSTTGLVAIVNGVSLLFTVWIDTLQVATVATASC
jgi:hypothetical protein